MAPLAPTISGINIEATRINRQPTSGVINDEQRFAGISFKALSQCRATSRRQAVRQYIALSDALFYLIAADDDDFAGRVE